MQINILDSVSILKLLKHLVFKGPWQVVILVDSGVALNSAAKGRNPSRGLTPVLRRVGCYLNCRVSISFLSFCSKTPEHCTVQYENLSLPEPMPCLFAADRSNDEFYEGFALPKVLAARAAA